MTLVVGGVEEADNKSGVQFWIFDGAISAGMPGENILATSQFWSLLPVADSIFVRALRGSFCLRRLVTGSHGLVGIYLGSSFEEGVRLITG